MFNNPAVLAIFAAYLYAFAVFFFYLFYIDTASDTKSSFFYDLHSKSSDYLSKLTFFLVIVTLLGTPVSLGFFLKTAVFVNLVLAGKLVTFAAIAVNLTLIIFYLQSVRQNQIQRKKRKTTNNVKKDLRGLSVYLCFFLTGSVFILTALCDISNALL